MSDEDIPQPRKQTQSAEILSDIASQLNMSATESRAEILKKALDKISQLNALFGSISVALKIDQPKNPIKVVDHVRDLVRKIEDPSRSQ